MYSKENLVLNTYLDNYTLDVKENLLHEASRKPQCFTHERQIFSCMKVSNYVQSFHCSL